MSGRCNPTTRPQPFSGEGAGGGAAVSQRGFCRYPPTMHKTTERTKTRVNCNTFCKTKLAMAGAPHRRLIEPQCLTQDVDEDVENTPAAWVLCCNSALQQHGLAVCARLGARAPALRDRLARLSRPRRRQATLRAPFASACLSVPTGHAQHDRAGEPAEAASSATEPLRRPKSPNHLLASASETTRTVVDAPAWRIVLGNLAAGATAGCAVEAALYPIDTIKTRLQLMRSGGGLKALLQAGGSKALYAGVGGNLAGVAPSTAIFLACYEPLKQAVTKRVPENRSFLGPLVAGATSGLVASVIRVPTEVVKQRMQSGEFHGTVAAVKTIVQREGLKGMYAGYGSFLLRDLPFDAIEFVAYEQLRKAYKAFLKGQRDINSLETSSIGAAAGAITGIMTTPLDVLKTRLMTQGSSGQYAGVIDCATKIWREEGSAAFLKGWEPRVIWIGLGGCVFFSALEQAKLFYAPKG